MGIAQIMNIHISKIGYCFLIELHKTDHEIPLIPYSFLTQYKLLHVY